MRIVATLFLVSHIGGLVWFASTVSGVTLLYAAVVGSLLALVAFMPTESLARLRAFGFVLAVAAASAATPVITQDLTLVNGPDYGAVLLRVASIAVALVILARARKSAVSA